MKSKFVLSVLILAISTASYAQRDPIREFIRHYHDSPNATDLRMQGILIRLAANETEDDLAARVLRKVHSLRMLELDNGEKPAAEDVNQLLKSLKAADFEQLAYAAKGEEKVNILIREKNGLIQDVLILANQAEAFLLLHIECSLRFSDLNDIEIDVDGAEHLKTLPEKRTRV